MRGNFGFRRKHAPAIVFAAAITVALGVSGCSGPADTPGEEETLRIGLLSAKVGAYQPYGESMSNGAKLAVEELNAAGGITIGDRVLKIELDEQESGGTANTGVTAFQTLLSNGTNLIVGVSASGEAQGIEPLVEREDVALVAAGVIYDGPLFHSGKAVRLLAPVGPLDAGQAQAGEQLGASKVAVFTNTGNAGIANATDSFLQAVDDLGQDVVAQGTYAPDATDFTSLLTQAKSQNVDTIYVRGLFADPLYMVKQANGLGMDDVQIISDTAGSPNDIAKVVDLSLLDNFSMFTNLTTLDLLTAGNEKATEFADSYYAKYGADAVADYAIQGHDAVYAMAAAIAEAGSTEPADVRAALFTVTSDSEFIDKMILPFSPFGSNVFDQDFGGINVAFGLRSFKDGELVVELSQVD
jgi:branched-chain amino acid transport system substrate-binding protein